MSAVGRRAAAGAHEARRRREGAGRLGAPLLRIGRPDLGAPSLCGGVPAEATKALPEALHGRGSVHAEGHAGPHPPQGVDLRRCHRNGAQGVQAPFWPHLPRDDTLQLSHKGCGPARAQESDDPQSLTSLKLGGCDRLTDAGLKELRHMSGLTSLNLRFCKSITDAGLKELRHMSGLTSLNLAGCWNFTDEGLKELRLMYRPVVRYVRQKWCSSGHFGAVFGTDFGEIAISPSVRI